MKTRALARWVLNSIAVAAITAGTVGAYAAAIVAIDPLAPPPTPPYAPGVLNPTWTMTSSCVAINAMGDAACQSIATGSTYKFRQNAKQVFNRNDVKTSVFRWSPGLGATKLSADTSALSTPTSINAAGHVGGYVASDGAGNGLIWMSAGVALAKPNSVGSLNDLGDYVAGGIAYNQGGTPYVFSGVSAAPTVVSNGREFGGTQALQATADQGSRTVGGVGWLYVTPVDDTGAPNFPAPTPYWNGFGATTSSVTSISDNGTIGISKVAMNGSFVGGYVGGICRHGSSSEYSPAGTFTVPWACVYTPINAAGLLGAYPVGVNNLGDGVGAYAPTSVAYATGRPTLPMVWLKQADGSTSEVDANTLVPSNSGWVFESVSGINDTRQIVGSGKLNGNRRGFVLTLDPPGITPPPPPPPPPPLAMAASALPGGQVGAAYQATLVRGGNAPYSIGLLAGALPSGLTVSTAGILSGTPLAASAAASFAIQVTDRAAKMASGSFTMNIAAAPAGTTVVDGSGTITAIGTDYIQINSVNIYYTAGTTIKFNDVSSFALGLRAQYKGIQSASGAINATSLEIN